MATDYNGSGPHVECGWKAERIERGLAAEQPANDWYSVRW